MTETRTLAEIVADLEPRLRDTLSSLAIAFDGERASVTLSFALYGPPGTFGRAGPYQVTVDTANMPEGVSLAGWERYPDQQRPVTLDVPIPDQIAALEDAGMVGSLDAARFDGGSDAVRAGYPATRWIVKTHAGSQNERMAWLRSVR